MRTLINAISAAALLLCLAADAQDPTPLPYMVPPSGSQVIKAAYIYAGSAQVPVADVRSYGAVTGTTDNEAAFNAAVAACPDGICTVFIPSGAWAIRTPGWAINQANVTIQCAPGATIQAQAKIGAILDIQASAQNVQIIGCRFDGNSNAARAISVDGAASNITIDHNEIIGVTLYGIVGNLRTAGPLRITNNNFHNLGSTAVAVDDLAGKTGAATAYLDDNRFASLTAIAAGASGDSYFEASRNLFTSDVAAGGEGSLYGYGVDNVDWQHNTFIANGAALHCDTCGAGTISFNIATASTNGVDFFAENASNITMQGNVSRNDAGGTGLILGTGSSVEGPANFRAQVFSFDSTKGFRPGTDVTLTSDSTDTEGGSTASMVATATHAFATGVLWYSNLSATTLFIYGYQDIWIKSTTATYLPGDFSLVCSVNTNLSTHDMVVPIPRLTLNTWVHVTQYQPGWQGALGQNGGGTGFNSCGLVANVSVPGVVIKFDNYQYAAEMVGDKVVDNSVISPLYVGIALGATQDALVEGNYVENAGAVHGENSSYQLANSPGTTFIGNTSNYSTGAWKSVDLTTIDHVVQSTTAVLDFAGNGATTYSTLADIGGQLSGSAPPAGNCRTGATYTKKSRSNDSLYVCTTGVWVAVGGSSGYAISALPKCSDTVEGAHAYVTNGQTSPIYLSAVSTAGNTVAPVFCNGADWVYD